MRKKFQQNELVYLAFGSNLGNRMQNFRDAIDELSAFFEIKQISHVIETEALLLEGTPASWNIPYLNMVISGITNYSPMELFTSIKAIEKKLGRDSNAQKWSPRIIDIDILAYYGQEIYEEKLTIPHNEIKNRDFIQYLLDELEYEIPNEIKIDIDNYVALNHFVLYPKFVGIVNVTPDSFSDGGKFLHPDLAEKQIRKLIADGATMVDVGAQSTRPGYTEISAEEEIARLNGVLERCSDVDCISLDTYSNEVLKYVIKKYPNIKCANVQQLEKLNKETIKLIANNNLKIIIMLQGTNYCWFENAINDLEAQGIQQANIIVDPGIGFGKNKRQNIEIIKNLHELTQFGCEIMLAHSRKSFISAFSNANASDRDIETVAFSSFAADTKAVDYVRVHDVEKHMKFFVAQTVFNSGT